MNTSNLVQNIRRELEIKELKMELMQLLLSINDVGLLKNIKEKIIAPSPSENPETEIVAYTPEGIPITKKEMEHSLQDSINQAKAGEVIDLEDLEKESESW